MQTKASYVMSQVRSLVDDPQGGFATDEYLTPFLQLAQDDFVLEVLQNPELGQLSTVVVIPNVAAFTTTLDDQTQAGHDLELLADIISMKERPVSGSRQEQDWVWMTRARDLPTITPAAFNSYYAWDGARIHLPGADQAVDIRVFGKFVPRPITDSESPIVPNTSPILAFATAALVAGSRGNMDLANRYEVKSGNASASFVTNAIMEMQSVKTRQRSFSGRGNVRR